MFTPSDGKRAIMQMGLVTSTGRHTALDSSVVFHEYTHGVTNRLIGGPMNIRPLDAIQSQSMGEGWSDYAACTANSSAVVGAWVVGKPGGIRIAPYDDSYPGHFGKIGADPYTKIHNIGEIWCAALLQMNRNIGANEGLQLVIDALRLTQANPSLLQARDAILRALDHKHSAGQLSDAQYVAAHGGVWRAFAKFGMGVNAQCDDARTLTGIVADFSVPDGVEPQPQPEPAPGAALHVESAPALAIPDADPNGITSALTITQVGQIQHLSIWLDIQHTYIGDPRRRADRPAHGERRFYERSGQVVHQRGYARAGRAGWSVDSGQLDAEGSRPCHRRCGRAASLGLGHHRRRRVRCRTRDGAFASGR